jgi:hypothetical protein
MTCAFFMVVVAVGDAGWMSGPVVCINIVCWNIYFRSFVRRFLYLCMVYAWRANNFIFVVSIPLCYIKFRSYTLSNTTHWMLIHFNTHFIILASIIRYVLYRY